MKGNRRENAGDPPKRFKEDAPQVQRVEYPCKVIFYT